MLLIVVPLVWLALATLFAALCRVAAYEDLDASGARGPFVQLPGVDSR